MDTISERRKREIVWDTEILHYNLGLLIKDCDSWLSEEEGWHNVQISWNKREKERKKMRRRKWANRIFKIFGMKRRYEMITGTTN